MAGVYISYPFCSQKCTYCNFASGVYPVAAQRRYEAALLAEIDQHQWAWKPETLYLGGGTPSQMDLGVLRDAMARIPAQSLVETTLECAPGTVTQERAAAWAAMGINRISLGVQSFVTRELRQTGRKHTAETVESDINLLAEVGITNVNIDLIAGLPGQTAASWLASLDWVERLHPPHVSVYIFEIDDDSALGREATLGGVRYGAEFLPSDDQVADCYEAAVERLNALGIPRYEVSNFARPGFESHHNLKYWQLEPYAGFGLDAHSFDGVMRTNNTDELDTYLRTIEEQRRPERCQVRADTEEEHFFVGLRLARGIEPSAREWLRFASAIARSVDAGLMKNEGGRLRLTDRGILISNDVLQEFVNV
ncbi:MAG: radical SAM family heme chaperone HemW [Bryobacteraceae bacterium]